MLGALGKFILKWGGFIYMSGIRKMAGLLCVLAAAGTAHGADFSYQQTTQITGGSMLQMMKMAGAFSAQARKAGDPIVSTVYLSGNREARVSQDAIEIIDLDKEAVTHLDLQKRTYYTMTFAEMRARIEAARAKAEREAAKQKPASGQDAASADPNVQANFDVKVRNTGAHKTVSGIDTTESIMTMTMVATDKQTQQSGAMGITNDMWMTPEIPGYGALRDFDKKYAEKLAVVLGVGGQDMARMLMANPGATQAMTKMAVEMQKLHGVPVMQVMRMGATPDGKPIPAASEAPLPQSQSPSGGDVAKSAIMNSLPFGFGRKKNQDQNTNQNQSANGSGAQNGAAGILMETQTTTTNFSTAAVDPSHFEVPAGMKEVKAPEGAY
jgi:hypothetical protein